MDPLDKARDLLRRFKGDAYLFGVGALYEIGPWVRRAGNRATLVRGTFPGSDEYVRQIRSALVEAGVELAAEVRGARPNAPYEDVLRIHEELDRAGTDVVISFGGGSTIDAVKAALVLGAMGGRIDDYFGTDLVTKALERSGAALPAHVAIQTVAGSAAHLTKYSNVTDLSTGQKKLIVDDAIVPAHPAFDYETTLSEPKALTADGAFDGMSHMLEVLYGAVGKPHCALAAEIVEAGLPLILEHLPRVMADPGDRRGREALALATDLGGYAIMIGGTNGAHLTSFSLVDVLPHGRACALMNPYYTVFFAPAIEGPLQLIADIWRRAGLTETDFRALTGRELGVAVAEAMFAFARRVGFPTRLQEVEGFTTAHASRALTAAKSPQLRMKLQNMPIPMTAEMVDDYMRPVLDAATQGDLGLIRIVS
ncbi:iron-containing alcohol dehydrogenase [Anaerobaca lacustris]|uniref:Iron-containing alcohol dehydrogenase n=1 Tax=Anaerobaca lacustris TaxID=3044600 RepID=A0AAW6TQ89_9BACT|nr:iron-containing alcohol dehydrogenase [Sedimentisphaerales bacterium M17dextr]